MSASDVGARDRAISRPNGRLPMGSVQASKAQGTVYERSEHFGRA